MWLPKDGLAFQAFEAAPVVGPVRMPRQTHGERVDGTAHVQPAQADLPKSLHENDRHDSLLCSELGGTPLTRKPDQMSPAVNQEATDAMYVKRDLGDTEWEEASLAILARLGSVMQVMLDLTPDRGLIALTACRDRGGRQLACRVHSLATWPAGALGRQPQGPNITL